MKKFLSLMLAMIMVMSLVTVGAGAAFTDADDIQYTEAVDLMTGLGILQGPGDGSFNPKGNLTRGAAAKIIAYIALGAKAADTMTYDTVMFPDVELTSSTAPYIAWCAEQGIINGYTDGTFGRKNNVTGHAFLKMALTAIGEFGQYTGTGWQIRVLNAANKAGVELLKGIDTDKVTLSDPLSREAACQIAFNAMKVNKTGVEGYLLDGKVHTDLTQALIYAQLTGITVEPTYVYVAGGQLLKDVHKVVATPITGVITENSANADTKLTTITYTDEDDNVVSETFNVDTKLAQLGNTVKAYVKTGTYDATKGYTVVSVTDSCTEFVVTEKTKTADLKAVLKATTATAKVAKLDSKGDVTEGAFTVPAIVLTGDDTVNGKDFVGEKGTLTLVISGKKVVGVKEALDKSLEKIGTVTTTADKQTIEIVGIADPIDNGVKNTTTGVVSDKINEYEGIAKGDIVVLTKIGDIYNVEKAQTLTGKPTKISGDTVTIDGVAYAKKGTGTAGKTPVAAADMDFSKEYVLYLDGQGNYIIATAKPGASVEKTKVFFLETKTYTTLTDGKLEETLYAVVVKMDGTIAEYKVADGFTKAQGTYEISANTKGVYTTWTAIGVEDANGVATADKNYKTADGIYYYADDVKFIAIAEKDDKWTTEVRTGKQKVDEAVTYIATAEKDKDGNKTGNYTVNTVIFLGDYDADAQTVKDIVYAVETKASTALVPYTNAAGKTDKGYEHTVYVDGVKTTIVVSFKDSDEKFDDAASKAAIKGFITLTKDGEGYTWAPKALGTALKNELKVTNVYGTLITAGTVEDIDAAEAEIIDLRTGSNITKVTTIAGLKDRTISFVIDETADPDVVATIYVIG